MNSLEAEYSFLAPTWRLPIVATTSMYSPSYGTSYLSNALNFSPDMTLWNDRRYNPRYIPSSTVRRNYPILANQQYNYQPINRYPTQSTSVYYQPINRHHTQPMSVYYQPSNNFNSNDSPNDEYESSNDMTNYDQSQQRTVNRGLTYSTNEEQNPRPPQQGQRRRVQIVDHHHHTPSTPENDNTTGRQSHNSSYVQPVSHQNHNVSYAQPVSHQNHNSTNTQPVSHQNPNSTNAQPVPHQNRNSSYAQPVSHQNHNSSYPQPVPHQNHNASYAQPVSRQNHSSELNRSQQKPKSSASNAHRDRLEENRYGYVGNNHNIHDYLYGLSAPDPGSYSNAFKQQQRRLQDEKLGRKSVMSEYKNFVQNSGFGPAFGTKDPQSYEEKIDIERRKKTYSKSVRQTNQYKIDEQKRAQNGHQKTRPVPVPKYQRARDYAEKIEKPHHLRPVSQTELSTPVSIISPILITSLSNHPRRSSSSNLADLVSGEFHINRSRRSSSLSSIHTQRRVRFHSRDFIRRRSSTILALPSHIIGKGIPHPPNSLSARYQTKKSASKLLDEEEKPSSNFSFLSPLNDNEKNSIISHSTLTSKHMRFPPTASVVINRTSKPSFIATTSTNHPWKNSTSKKERFPSQRPFTARPISSRKSAVDFRLNIRSLRHDDQSSNG